MAALSHPVALEFCKLCGWAYETWLNHRELFDRNPRATELQNSWAADELARLSTISQEYALLQVAKLHDPAVVSGKITLGIDYVVLYGAWDATTRGKLEVLQSQLNSFGSQLRGVRNKSLSHTTSPPWSPARLSVPSSRATTSSTLWHFRSL
jgi:hypothetical protein